MEMHVDREIAASPARVWAIITDLDRYPTILSGVERVERLDERAGFEVGTRWRETRVMFGREATEEMEVAAIDAGRSYTVTADGGGTNYRSVLRVEPMGERHCRLSMSFAAAPSGTAGRLAAATIGRLFQRATRKMLQRDLDDIAAYADAESAM
jgi:carbon monoxide dehydrogenase subunit G